MNSEYITEAIMERQSSVSREDLGRREEEDFKLLLFVHKTNLIVQADIRTLPILRRIPPAHPVHFNPQCREMELGVRSHSLSLSTHDDYIAWIVSSTPASPGIFYINPTKIAEISVCCLLKEFYSGEYYRI